MNHQVAPQAPDAESSILGAMLKDQAATLKAITALSADDFYRPAHAEIFAACHALFASGSSVDLITVAEAIKAAGKINSIGGLAYLSSLVDMIPFPGMVDRYAPLVKEKAAARRLIALSARMMERCYRDEPIKVITEDFSREFFDIITDKAQGARHISKVVEEVKAEIQEFHENGVGAGIPTGYIDIDSRWNGMQRGELIILAARPSMGKTALAVNVGVNAAKRGNRVLIFTMEMKDRSLVQRIMSSLSRVSGDSIRKGNLPEEYLTRVMDAGTRAAKLPIMIDETPGLSITELTARAKMCAMKTGTDLIIVDYLQLMTAKAENRTQEISVISRGLKALAKELNVPVLALSQLNRGVDERPDKRPVMRDLRESGAIEQDADVIAFIYRDDYYNRDEDNPLRGQSEIITAKQRNGPTGMDKMVFRGEFSQFLTMEQNR